MKDNDKKPMEVSLEEGNASQQLKDLLDAKAKEKLKLQNMKDLHILKKSRFYKNSDGNLREHIASYKGYAILLKQEKIKEELNNKEMTMFPSLIKLNELKNMKRVNGNIVRKINPESIHEYEKMALIQGTITEIDKGL